jgi:hypothetical protein
VDELDLSKIGKHREMHKTLLESSLSMKYMS